MATTIYSLSHNDEVRYIGKTIRPLGVRLTRHIHDAKSGASYHVSRWIRSLDARPQINALAIVEDVLSSRTERGVIAIYRKNGCRLTNITDGGEGTLGYRHTREALIKIGAVHKGKIVSAEHRERMRTLRTGKRLTEEQRARLKGMGLGRRHSDESKAKMSAVQKGRQVNAEQRARISAAQIGRRPSAETRAKMSAAHMGHKVSSLTRAKIGTRFKGGTLTPEHRDKLSAAHRGKTLTPEHRANIGKSLKQFHAGTGVDAVKTAQAVKDAQ